MDIVVQKFGGSSVADTEKLYNICKHIIREYNNKKSVVVVVSAQGKTTDRLISEEKEITENPIPREHDVLVSVGEQITISKLAMCLKEKGYNAISYTGWQLPIITDSVYGGARIKYIETEKIKKQLEAGNIVIIAGFQGINENGDITTLGRGGSDTTAVALAASLKAERCDIYTDVDGVYSSDPRLIENVKKLDEITYDEMLELASLGAKVLHNRCVEIGKNYKVPINVKSTFENEPIGTRVLENKELEALYITGVAKDDNITRITIIGLENKIGRTYNVFKLLSENKINVDTIVQSAGEHAIKDISFTVKNSETKKTLKILNENLIELGAKEITHCDKLSKISVVGVGIVNNPGVAAKVFEALYENNINMHMVSTSEIKISVLVNKKEANLALKAIHNKFY